MKRGDLIGHLRNHGCHLQREGERLAPERPAAHFERSRSTSPIYADRTEIHVARPHTVTVEQTRARYWESRNELVKVLRDDHSVEATGLGVPRKIGAGSRAHTRSGSDLLEQDDRFLVRPGKEPRP